VNRLLLDMHAFLWWIAASPKLRRDARTAIADATTLVHVSAITIWEITIKRGSTGLTRALNGSTRKSPPMEERSVTFAKEESAMASTLTTWQSAVHSQLNGWRHRMRRAGSTSLYNFLSASTISVFGLLCVHEFLL